VIPKDVKSVTQDVLVTQENPSDSDSEDSLIKEMNVIQKVEVVEVEEFTPKPIYGEEERKSVDIVLNEKDEIEYIGDVYHLIDNVLVVKHAAICATLDIESVLCLEDRTILGMVQETFGPCKSPYYSVILSPNKNNETDLMNLENKEMDKSKIENNNTKFETESINLETKKFRNEGYGYIQYRNESI